MKLFVVGLRRSGTTILYDALREDPDLRCYYEPLREDDETIGGGSGARDVDVFASTREAREQFRAERYPELHAELFNWGGPRDPGVELEPGLADHVRDLLAYLLQSAPDVAIKETRLHHKLAAIAELAPDAAVVHMIRDPRAVTASMLLGRRRRTDIYTDADTFFTARTGRRLWSSRQISERLVAEGELSDLPADLPDFLRPLILWKSAFAATDGDGRRLFGDRYAIVRLEDLRADPRAQLTRIYALAGRPVPDWGREVDRETTSIARRASTMPRTRAGRGLRPCSGWSRSSRPPATGGILELDLRLRRAARPHPPAPRSRLAGFMGRARRRARALDWDAVKARVLIRPKEGILDPQGKAVERALPALGFDGISHVRVGRMVELEAENGADLEALCEKLLANPLIEDYEIERRHLLRFASGDAGSEAS